MATQAEVVLKPTVVDEEGARFVSIAVLNNSDVPVAITTLDRYLTIELKDQRGQFVTGTETDTTIHFPTGADYLEIKKRSTAEGVYRLEVGAETIGTVHFGALPTNATIRVTYKADRVMPGLPAKLKNIFYSGPTPPKSLEVDTSEG